MHNIGKTIRLLRLQRGWSQDDVAHKLGISIPAFSKIETGVTDLSVSRAGQIADLFELSLVGLLSSEKRQESTYQTSLESAKERLRTREDEIMTLQRKVIELFEQLKQPI